MQKEILQTEYRINMKNQMHISYLIVYWQVSLISVLLFYFLLNNVS